MIFQKNIRFSKLSQSTYTTKRTFDHNHFDGIKGNFPANRYKLRAVTCQGILRNN